MDPSQGDRPAIQYVIVNPDGEPVPGFTPFTDLVDAMRAARALGTRNTVMKINGTYQTPMSHQGPGGWRPKMKKGGEYLC